MQSQRDHVRSEASGSIAPWRDLHCEPEMTVDRLEARTASIRLRAFDASAPLHRIAPADNDRRAAA